MYSGVTFSNKLLNDIIVKKDDELLAKTSQVIDTCVIGKNTVQ